MLWRLRTAVLLAPWLATGSASPSPQSPAATVPAPDAEGKYTLVSEGIRAQFIPYGASITNLFINDTAGIERDVILGFDNATYYSLDKSHPHLGGVPGRYANRIKNSSFTIDGQAYKVLANENNGQNTLHGGPNGWDYRNWTVDSYTADTIVFSLDDPDGSEGFPGRVTSTVTYKLTPYAWDFVMTAKSLTKKTPIMLSSHAYWNLDGFQNPSSATALNHSLHMPYAGTRVGVDGILIPTGEVLPNKPGSPNDFWSRPKQIGRDLDATLGNCGTGCVGYDNCYITDRAAFGWDVDWRSKPVTTLYSDFSGINLDIYTDQDAFQVYSCGGQNGTLALKKTQGFFDDPSRPRTVQKYGCVVMEVQDYIDGINQPEWFRARKQIWGPTDPEYRLSASYRFSVKGRNQSVQ